MAAKGLSRLGDGEPSGVGFLERDQAAGELEQGKVVLVLLRPADQQCPVTVEPGVAGLDNPTTGTPAGRTQLELDLFTSGADVRGVPAPGDELAHAGVVVAAVEAERLR